MNDPIDKFFDAYTSSSIMMSVFTAKVPKEMMRSSVDKDGWYEWRLLPSTLGVEDYHQLAKRFNAVLPSSFIEWHRRYFFADCDTSIVRLPESLPSNPFEAIAWNLDAHGELIALGLIPFASEGNDAGPLVFDTRNTQGEFDFPIRVYDHDYGSDLSGLSEIVFSSFSSLLECMTHFMRETKTRKRSEVLLDFFEIDPTGAGSTGRAYWECWIEMEESHDD